MPVKLELLAPARNKDIGIAAIDCGADAVYIAGPAFGAREAAGNSFSTPSSSRTSWRKPAAASSAPWKPDATPS